MPTKTVLTVILALVLAFSAACTDKAKEAEKAKQDAAAKARADAAKKEMETLPKTFSTPDYYKKNEPAQSAAPASAKTDSPKK